MDLLGARTPEVAVVHEHATRARRVLLVEQQLQRLLAADQVGGAQLPGQGSPVLSQIGLPRPSFGGQRRTLGGAFRPDCGARRPSPHEPC